MGPFSRISFYRPLDFGESGPSRVNAPLEGPVIPRSRRSLSRAELRMRTACMRRRRRAILIARRWRKGARHCTAAASLRHARTGSPLCHDPAVAGGKASAAGRARCPFPALFGLPATTACRDLRPPSSLRAEAGPPARSLLCGAGRPHRTRPASTAAPSPRSAVRSARAPASALPSPCLRPPHSLAMPCRPAWRRVSRVVGRVQ